MPRPWLRAWTIALTAAGTAACVQANRPAGLKAAHVERLYFGRNIGDTAIVSDGRMTGDLAGRKAGIVDRFKKGIPPARVAEAIVDAVRTNPAVRTVGRDAWALHQLTKLAPQAIQRLGGVLQRRSNHAD